MIKTKVIYFFRYRSSIELIVKIELSIISFMLSSAGSFVHFAMVKAIFSTERSRTNQFIEDHLH